MKFLLVLCAVTACALEIPSEDGKDFIEKFKEMTRACIVKSGTTKEVAKMQLAFGDFSVRDEPAQCFTDCMSKRLGFTNENGEVLPDAITKNIKKWSNVKTGSVEEITNRCVQERGEGKCETSFKIFECYRPHILPKTAE